MRICAYCGKDKDDECHSWCEVVEMGHGMMDVIDQSLAMFLPWQFRVPDSPEERAVRERDRL